MSGINTPEFDDLKAYPHEQRRREWLQTSIEVTRSLLSSNSGEEPLHAVARAVNSNADADLTLVVLPTDGAERLMIEVAVGEGTEHLVGFVFEAEESITGEVIRTGQPLLASDVADRRRRTDPRHLTDGRGRPADDCSVDRDGVHEARRPPPAVVVAHPSTTRTSSWRRRSPPTPP